MVEGIEEVWLCPKQEDKTVKREKEVYVLWNEEKIMPSCTL